MSILCDSSYAELSKAIIAQAERDYCASAQRLQKKHYSRRWQYDGDVATFFGCQEFFRRGCNEMVGADGEEVLRLVNSRNKIDVNAVKERIERGYDV